MIKQIFVILSVLLLIVGCGKKVEQTKAEVTTFDGESHFGPIKQLTFGGQNAEAYFSYNADQLIFQSMMGDMECDQIYTMNSDGSNVKQVSTGDGVTTCSFIAPDGKSIIYASTHLGGEACPPKPASFETSWKRRSPRLR